MHLVDARAIWSCVETVDLDPGLAEGVLRPADPANSKH
jgi:hypothetical protein